MKYETRAQWHNLYKLARWQKLREWQLRHNPLCVFCLEQDLAVPATVVDHKIPHKGDLTLFWDTANLQSLCKRHHDSDKQKIEKNDNPEIGLDGWPVEK